MYQVFYIGFCIVFILMVLRKIKVSPFNSVNWPLHCWIAWKLLWPNPVWKGSYVPDTHNLSDDSLRRCLYWTDTPVLQGCRWCLVQHWQKYPQRGLFFFWLFLLHFVQMSSNLITGSEGAYTNPNARYLVTSLICHIQLHLLSDSGSLSLDF